MSDLTRTDVVTAFLRHAGKVLLLQRSDRVGSYRGRWAGVSGYLEESTPLAQALREIREETGLADDALRLAASAAPLEVPAPAYRKLWVVHPFLFDIDDPERVQLDWETQRCAWFDPREVGGLATVPMLAEALQACLHNEHARER